MTMVVLADGKGELGRTVDFKQAGCGCERGEQVPRREELYGCYELGL